MTLSNGFIEKCCRRVRYSSRPPWHESRQVPILFWSGTFFFFFEVLIICKTYEAVSL